MDQHSNSRCHSQKMDNGGYESDAKSNVELGDVVTSQATSTTPGVCPDTCFSHHQQLIQASSKSPESPWHPLKTIFLLGAVICMTIWVLVYALLNHFTIL